ncbi:MAG: polymer-forming cytoskeletal protein [Planctomycetes bacterium]|nr:polymer-forming cytoskeletal protein [Planctomycetota bacterium]
MSPIRPVFNLFHLRTPRPSKTRDVRCSNCSHQFEVSQRALVVRCPRCTHPVRLEDVTIRHEVHGDMHTLGNVRITPGSTVVGRLVCSQLVNAGKLDGQINVTGSIELMENSSTTGELHGQSLRVFLGANLRGKAMIAPNSRKKLANPVPA